MINKKYIGIWMDHSHAHVMELNGKAIISSVIKSEFDHEGKVNSIKKSENLMHNKEQHEQANYYKRISDGALNAKEIVLFGPTTAKSELMNLLKNDQHFKDVNVVIRPADKMTENQQCEFVRNHFETSIIK